MVEIIPKRIIWRSIYYTSGDAKIVSTTLVHSALKLLLVKKFKSLFTFFTVEESQLIAPQTQMYAI